MRRLLLAAVALWTTAFVVSAIAMFALLHGWQRDWLREQLELQLASALEMPVAIESLDGVLYRDVTLRGLRIGEPGEPTLALTSLHLDIGSIEIAPTPGLTLDDAVISGAHVTLRRTEGGSWPWQATRPEAGESEAVETAWPLRLHLRSLRVEDSRVELVERAEKSQWIELAGGASDVELREEPSFRALQLSFSAAQPDRGAEPWMHGRAHGGYNAGRWQLDELRVEGPVVELTAQGSGDDRAIEAAEFSLALPSIAELADHILDGDSAAAGAIALSGKLRGAYHWPQGDLAFDARTLSIEGLELGDIHLEARSPEEGHLRIEALRFEHGPLQATADAGAKLVSDPASTQLEALRLRSPDGTGTLSIDASVPRDASDSADASVRDASDSAEAIGRHPETRMSLRSVAWPLATLHPLWTQLGIGLAGNLDAELDVRGTPEGLAAHGVLTLENGSVASKRARAEGIGLELRLDGAVAAPELAATGRATRLVVDERTLGVLDFGLRSSDGRTLTIDHFALHDGPVAWRVAPDARLRYEDSQLRFENFALVSEGQRIALSGGVSAERADALEIELAPLDVGQSVELLQSLGVVQVGVELSGKLAGSLEWDGPAEHPELGGELAWSEAQFGEIAFERIDAKVQTRASEIRLTSDWQRGGHRALNLNATLPRNQILVAPRALLSDAATAIEVRSNRFDLAALTTFLPAAISEMSGRMDAAVDVRGGAPDATLAGRISIAEGLVKTGTLRTSPAEPEATSGSAEGVHIDVTLGGSLAAPQISAVGSVSRIVVGKQRLGELDFATQTEDGRSWSIDRLALHGGPAPLRIAPHGGPAPLRIAPHASLHLQESGVSFENLAIEGEGQRITLSGGVSDTGAQALRLDFVPLDVGRSTAILQALGLIQVGAKLSGHIVGHVAWDGARVLPELSSELAWHWPRLGSFPFDRIDMRVDTRETEVEIASDWIREGRSALALGATLPREQIFVSPDAILFDPRTRGVAQTDAFELGALAAFMPKAISELGGVLSAKIDARGGTPRPSVLGNVSIDQGSIKLAALGGQILAPIRARLNLVDERFALEELQIGEAGALVRVRGEALLMDMEPRSLDLQLDFDAFALNAPGLVRGTLSGPLRLAGEREAMDLTGKLELADLNIQIPEPENPAFKEIQVISADSQDQELAIREQENAAALLDRLRVDLGVTIARNSWARGRGAEVELQGAFEAKKERRLPLALSGTVETVRGTYEIYGRRFRIERGRAVLDGGAEVDPVLDVRALHRVRSVRIFAIVEGRLSEPHLRFESNPELSETDIASYLLLGRPVSEAGGGQQPGLDAAAAQIAAGAAMREFEKVFGGALPVDLIDVRVDENAGKSEVRAGVGKYVGDRLFLHYERGFGDEPEDELKAEYQLTPHWSIESSVSPQGETGADLIFEIEY